jgi:hypothetical protein
MRAFARLAFVSSWLCVCGASLLVAQVFPLDDEPKAHSVASSKASKATTASFHKVRSKAAGMLSLFSPLRFHVCVAASTRSESEMCSLGMMSRASLKRLVARFPSHCP